MYENLMTRFTFGGLDTPGIYLDETVMRMCGTHRRIFSMLAARLVQEGKLDKAARVVAKVEKVIPPSSVPHNYSSGSLELARVWNTLGKKKEATDIAYPVAIQAAEYLEWYLTLPDKVLLQSERDCMYYLYQMHSAVSLLNSAGSDKTLELTNRLNTYNNQLQTRLYGSVGMDAVDEDEDEEVYEEEE
jgi:ATP/maltotriose-dependent transcriptional regulator MalT